MSLFKVLTKGLYNIPSWEVADKETNVFLLSFQESSNIYNQFKLIINFLNYL